MSLYLCIYISSRFSFIVRWLLDYTVSYNAIKWQRVSLLCPWPKEVNIFCWTLGFCFCSINPDWNSTHPWQLVLSSFKYWCKMMSFIHFSTLFSCNYVIKKKLKKLSYHFCHKTGLHFKESKWYDFQRALKSLFCT